MNKLQKVLLHTIYIIILPFISIYQLFFDIKPTRSQIVKKFKGAMVLLFMSIIFFILTLFLVMLYLNPPASQTDTDISDEDSNVYIDN